MGQPGLFDLFESTGDFSYVPRLKSCLLSEMNMISLVDQESNPDIIRIYLESIQHLNDLMFGVGVKDTKHEIKNGLRGFKGIKDKCINMGVV